MNGQTKDSVFILMSVTNIEKWKINESIKSLHRTSTKKDNWQKKEERVIESNCSSLINEK